VSEPGERGDDPGPSRSRRIGLGFAARIRAYFLTGVLVTAPISITLYLAWLLIDAVDSWVARVIPRAYNPETLLPLWIPGIGLLLVAVALVIIGWFAAGYLGRVLVRLGEGALARVPVVRSLYAATKQLFETVLANKSQAFREVVLVEFPRRDAWTVAFVTGEPPAEALARTGEPMVCVFVPTAPTPTGGYVLFVPERDVVRTSMTVEEALKLVVSTGIVAPPRRPADEAPAPAARRPSLEAVGGQPDRR
jgi:uncharacterized membrane protein